MARRDDDDLLAVRGELARSLTGLANALTTHGDELVVRTLVDLTTSWRAVRELPSPQRWARDRLARASLGVVSDPLVLAPDDAGTPEQVDAARAIAVVRALPPLPRAALVLALVDGLDEEQIAHALDVAPRKAQAALAEARTLVTERLPDPPEPVSAPAAPPAPAPAASTPPVAPPPSDDDLFAPPWRRSGA